MSATATATTVRDVPVPVATHSHSHSNSTDDMDVFEVLAAWWQAENAEFLVARAGVQASYMQAICDEVDVMMAYALARASGAPQDEVREVRELLAQVTAKREAAARDLGLTSVLPDAVRTCADMLAANLIPAQMA